MSANAAWASITSASGWNASNGLLANPFELIVRMKASCSCAAAKSGKLPNTRRQQSSQPTSPAAAPATHAAESTNAGRNLRSVSSEHARKMRYVRLPAVIATPVSKLLTKASDDEHPRPKAQTEIRARLRSRKTERATGNATCLQAVWFGYER